MIDLSGLIRVRMCEPGDPEGVFTEMTEFEARSLLHDLGIPRPPVLCDKHERMEIIMETLDA